MTNSLANSLQIALDAAKDEQRRIEVLIDGLEVALQHWSMGDASPPPSREDGLVASLRDSRAKNIPPRRGSEKGRRGAIVPTDIHPTEPSLPVEDLDITPPAPVAPPAVTPTPVVFADVEDEEPTAEMLADLEAEMAVDGDTVTHASSDLDLSDGIDRSSLMRSREWSPEDDLMLARIMRRKKRSSATDAAKALHRTPGAVTARWREIRDDTNKNWIINA